MRETLLVSDLKTDRLLLMAFGPSAQDATLTSLQEAAMTITAGMVYGILREEGAHLHVSHDPKLVCLALPELAALEATLQADE